MTTRAKKAARAAFRAGVLARDGYRCKVCGVEGGADCVELDPHHIFGRVIGDGVPADVVENGITLCPVCHFVVEKVGDPEKVAALVGTDRVTVMMAALQAANRKWF